MSARILNITLGEYLKDPFGPSLSASIASTLISRSPLHAWLQHPRLGAYRKPPTKSMDEGTLIHKLVLGEGQRIEVLDVSDFRTKAAQEARDNAIAAGFLPVKRSDYDQAMEATLIIKGRLSQFGIALDGASELPVEWTEDGVLCRCRMDHVFTESGQIFDVKKTESAHPQRIQRSMLDYGMSIQASAYIRAVEALKPELAGRTTMMFLFVETEPPYAVVPATLNGAFRAYGESQWLKAVEIWRRCLEHDEWPGYCTEPVTIDLPPWLVKEMVEVT